MKWESTNCPCAIFVHYAVSITSVQITSFPSPKTSPIQDKSIAGSGSVQYGVAAELTADVTATATVGNPSAFTYRWYRVNAAGERTAIENAGGGRFSPGSNCTRARIVIFLYRADQGQ